MAIVGSERQRHAATRDPVVRNRIMILVAALVGAPPMSGDSGRSWEPRPTAA